jgi:UPF0271 protein
MTYGRFKMKVNLNADMGESFGRYTLGNDQALIPFVNTVHVACGYHAADPGTMLRSVQLAKLQGVELGAHVSYPDLMGFGRRRMSLSEDEVFEITHVKPHGELYLTAVRDKDTARGLVRAVKAVDPNLMLLMYGPIVTTECKRAGVAMVHEAYVDLDYNPDGSLVLERKKAARDPSTIAARAVDMLQRGGVNAIDGSWLEYPVEAICLHVDGPNAVEHAKTVRQGIINAGYELVTLRSFIG